MVLSEKLQGKEKIIGLIVGLITAVAVTFIPTLEPLEDSLGAILLLIAAWILGGAVVEASDKVVTAVEETKNE